MFFTENTKLPKKKLQIVITATDLFQRFGFKRITIEELCLKAGVSKMTFYKYFQNKDELVKYLANELLLQAETAMHEIDAMDIPFTTKIKKFLKLKEDAGAKLSREFIVEYMNPDTEMQLFFTQFYERATNLFIEFIQNSQQKGEVRKDIKPEFLIAAINKLIDLAKDETLIDLYPRAMDFTLEINKFMCFGILPIETPVMENAE